jgi:hypothetical protein
MLLGLTCIHIADIDEDRRHNTDLMFDVNRARYPVRVRRLRDRLPYNRRNEIPFRFSRRTHIHTEFAKLMAGWDDYCLYGWGDEHSQRVVAYTLLNLDIFRGWMSAIVIDRLFAVTGDSGLPLGVTLFHDHDSSASFLAFCLDCLPQEIIQHRISALPTDSPNIDSHWSTYHDPLRDIAPPSHMRRSVTRVG